METPFSPNERTASSISGRTRYTPAACSTQSQPVFSELFSYWPKRTHLTPESKTRVHQCSVHGKRGSRGRGKFMPKPSESCVDRRGGTLSGEESPACAD